jgi:hypothetical protein
MYVNVFINFTSSFILQTFIQQHIYKQLYEKYTQNLVVFILTNDLFYSYNYIYYNICFKLKRRVKIKRKIFFDTSNK